MVVDEGGLDDELNDGLKIVWVKRLFIFTSGVYDITFN